MALASQCSNFWPRSTKATLRTFIENSNQTCMKYKVLLLLGLLLCGPLAAQEYFPDNDSVKEQNTNYTAFTGATIYVTPTKKLDNATLVIRAVL